jgi:hypothetical protein
VKARKVSMVWMAQQIGAGSVSDYATQPELGADDRLRLAADCSFILIRLMIAAFKATHAKQRENCKNILDMRDHNGDQRDRERIVFRGRPARTRDPRHFCYVRSVSKPRHSVGRSDLSRVAFTRGHRCHGTDDEPGSIVRRGYRCPIARRK